MRFQIVVPDVEPGLLAEMDAFGEALDKAGVVTLTGSYLVTSLTTSPTSTVTITVAIVDNVHVTVGARLRVDVRRGRATRIDTAARAVMLDDGSTQLEVTVFNEVFEASRPWIREDELLVVRGKAALVKKIADELIAAKGVKHGKLTVTSTGKDLPT